MWLSVWDCAQIHKYALEAETGTSSSTGSPTRSEVHSLERAKEVLGYETEDSSTEWDGDERLGD